MYNRVIAEILRKQAAVNTFTKSEDKHHLTTLNKKTIIQFDECKKYRRFNFFLNVVWFGALP